ncbi:PAN domain-containing protein [Moumouvirus australiensis]|uniref:PAN domain-containing protein n=1 Tax=Moumouvirus australiensis TaxID=2109587 RepID=A0A2P1ELE8_9VIRU|nr:PAN domain-containing protein [Moumouvirus australiensis]AVL94716.1 PAN domain-containing protein [Moumouvirus australiensis]
MNIWAIIIIILIILLLVGLGLYIYFEFIRKSNNTPNIPTPTPNTPTPNTPTPNTPTPNTPTPNTPTPNTPSNCPTYGSISGMDITGFNMPNTGTRISEQECQSLCSSTPGCNWYNYDTTDQACYLKEGNKNNFLVTGFKVPNPETGCPQWSRLSNIDITGFDVGKSINNSTEQQCQEHIVQNNLPFYSYDHINNICYPKKGNSSSNIVTGFPIIS